MKKNYVYLIGLAVILSVVVNFGLQSLFSKSNSKLYVESNNTNLLPANYLQREAINQDITNSRETAITRTVRKVSPAVVGINVTEIREYRDPFFSFFDDPFFRDDPFFKRFFGDRTYKQEVHSLGSGFIISPDGYIVTNDHVAGNAKKIVVTLTNGERYDAEIVGSDPQSDICLLKINGKNLPYVVLGNSDDVIIGEWVIALGNPFGLFGINNKPTVTVGVVKF